MGVTRTEPFQCPQCFRMNDAFGTMDRNDNYKPAKDAVTVCIGCGTVSIFEEDLSLRLATEEDMKAILSEDPKAYKTILKAQAIIAARNRTN